jgi:hypothetical protein
MRPSPPKATDPKSGGYQAILLNPAKTESESDTDTEGTHDHEISDLMCWNETEPPPPIQHEPLTRKPWQGISVPSSLTCQTCHNPNIRAKAKCNSCGNRVYGPYDVVTPWTTHTLYAKHVMTNKAPTYYPWKTLIW